jgi:hypothetical protein
MKKQATKEESKKKTKRKEEGRNAIKNSVKVYDAVGYSRLQIFNQEQGVLPPELYAAAQLHVQVSYIFPFYKLVLFCRILNEFLSSFSLHFNASSFGTEFFADSSPNAAPSRTETHILMFIKR